MAEKLILEDVYYTYPLGSNTEQAAISGVSLEINPGEVLCIVGPNGSGKSTLSLLCAGLLKPTSGKILYGDYCISRTAGRKEIRGKIGIFFQSAEDHLFSDTVFDDIAFGPKNLGLSGKLLEERVEYACDMVGLPLNKFAERSPFALSQGEKRRVALAGVLALKPDLLILDEPFIGLDYEGRKHLTDAIEKYKESREISVIAVTHEIKGFMRLASRFAVLKNGKIIYSLSPKELPQKSEELKSSNVSIPEIGEIANELESMGAKIKDPLDVVTLAMSIQELRRRQK